MRFLFVFLSMICFTNIISAQTVPTSETILNEAYKQAAKENKNVFVIFHASWCGWCKKLDASMTDPATKKYFDKSFVIVHLTVQENDANRHLQNPGADIFLAKYKGSEAGLPFFLILDKDGKLLGDSFMNGANMGCPASVNEVASFVTLLKKTSRIGDEEVSAVTARFRKNEAR